MRALLLLQPVRPVRGWKRAETKLHAARVRVAVDLSVHLPLLLLDERIEHCLRLFGIERCACERQLRLHRCDSITLTDRLWILRPFLSHTRTELRVDLLLVALLSLSA